MTPPFFEHIALAVHADDLAAWDRVLRGGLGGAPSLGGAEKRGGFQGGQITYPGGGMLELVSWLPDSEPREPGEPGETSKPSAMARYLAKQGARAALHHLTFLVADFDAAHARVQELGYQPMVGRKTRVWKELFVREPALRPKGMLIQLLQTDKDALFQIGWRADWAPFEAKYPAVEPASIRGIRLACSELAPAERLFTELLEAQPEKKPEAKPEKEGDASAETRTLRWAGSSMCVELVHSEDARASQVLLEGGRGLAGTPLPDAAQQLLHLSTGR